MNQQRILCYGITVLVILAIIYLLWTIPQGVQPYMVEGLTSTTSVTPVPVTDPIPTPSQATPSEINGFPFAGCWRNDPASKFFQTISGISNAESCVNYAKSVNASAVALTKQPAGSPFVCNIGYGGGFKTAGQVPVSDSGCNASAPGDGTNVVYSTIKPEDPASQEPYYNGYKFKGCYNVKSGGSSPLPIYLGSQASFDCFRLALANGFKTFGVTNLKQCFAGNLNATTLVDDYTKNGLFDTKANPFSCDISGMGPDSVAIYSILDESATPATTQTTTTSTTSTSTSATTPTENTATSTTTPFLTYPIASKELNGYNYVGCWKDTGSPRPLTTKLGDNQTMASCINLAKSKGFDTAALQASSHTCWAGNQGVNGNNYHMYDQKQDSDPTCNINSPGSWTNVTYSTTPVPVMAPAPTPAPAPVPVATTTTTTDTPTTTSTTATTTPTTTTTSSDLTPTTTTTATTTDNTTSTTTPVTNPSSTPSSTPIITPAPVPSPTSGTGTTPLPTPTTTSSWFSPRSYIQSQSTGTNGKSMSNVSLPTLPTNFTRNLENTQQKQQQQETQPIATLPPNFTSISFEPSASTTTTITFSQVPSDGVEGSSGTSTSNSTTSDPVVSDSSTYYPYKSVLTTQPTAQQLMPYLSDLKASPNSQATPKSSPLISAGGGSYFFSSTPQQVSSTSV